MTPSRLARARVFLLPAVLLLAVTLPHLGQGDFRSDTGWYSAIGLQAWRTGSLWTLYAEPEQLYFNKPPLALWIHGLFLHLFGVSVITARLPSVTAALGCVLLTVAIVQELATRRAAVFSGIALALSLEFFRRVRETSLDMWQLLFMLAAVWLASIAVRRERWPLLAAAGVPLGLALMCKPLIALLAIPILGAWLIWAGHRRGVPWLAGTLLLALVVAAPWHISMWLVHGRAFTDQYFGAEIAERAEGRLGNLNSHAPPWYYLQRLATLYWPWLAFAALALVRWLRVGELSRDNIAAKLALLWTATWLIALSIFVDRRDRYALPLYPGLAALCGLWLAAVPALRVLKRWMLRWLGPTAIIAAACLSLAPILIQLRPDVHWPELFAWIHETEARQHAPVDLWQGGFSPAHGARVYLETGRWPHPTDGRPAGQPVLPPAGALLLYHVDDDPAPGQNEQQLWVSSDAKVRVMRLGAGAWVPLPRPRRLP